jgi:hypothetical protein
MSVARGAVIMVVAVVVVVVVVTILPLPVFVVDAELALEEWHGGIRELPVGVASTGGMCGEGGIEGGG